MIADRHVFLVSQAPDFAWKGGMGIAGEGDYMAQDFQLSADGAELKKFGVLNDLIQIIIFPVPQCPHLECVNIRDGYDNDKAAVNDVQLLPCSVTQ